MAEGMRDNVRRHVAQLVLDALKDAQSEGLLPPADVDSAAIERPPNPEHGEFASSLPLKLARPMRMSPIAIAECVASRIAVEEPLGSVWVARPGFINFSLLDSWLTRQVEAIREAGEEYGNVSVGEGERVQVEFVSVNPTGPLHVAHARGAVIGSALANVLSAAGYDVEREYYINDAGNQMDKFNESLFARYQQLLGNPAELPEDGYVGGYMVELAREIREAKGDRFADVPPADAISELGEIGLRMMLDAIREDLEALRVDFEVWFSERSLYRCGQYDRGVDLLRQRGQLAERDGATWFDWEESGDHKQAVVVRTNGAPTYFASDIAYHYNKFVERGFDRVIDVWGADHQGHVARMKAVVDALGIPPERLTLLLNQLVTLRRGDELVRLSKRSGEIVTLRELVEEVGADACRFFFLSRSAESQMEFDLELAKQQSAENPVYYVQYAHARIASILRIAEERGIDFTDGDVSLLTHDAELALIRKAMQLPEVVEMMALSLEPHHLPHYAGELATAFHWFYQNCRVISGVEGEEAVTKARLKLVDAARVVLARCLRLMDVEAPQHM